MVNNPFTLRPEYSIFRSKIQLNGHLEAGYFSKSIKSAVTILFYNQLSLKADLPITATYCFFKTKVPIFFRKMQGFPYFLFRIHLVDFIF